MTALNISAHASLSSGQLSTACTPHTDRCHGPPPLLVEECRRFYRRGFKAKEYMSPFIARLIQDGQKIMPRRQSRSFTAYVDIYAKSYRLLIEQKATISLRQRAHANTCYFLCSSY